MGSGSRRSNEIKGFKSRASRTVIPPLVQLAAQLAGLAVLRVFHKRNSRLTRKKHQEKSIFKQPAESGLFYIA
jgi:hypothetical protein